MIIINGKDKVKLYTFYKSLLDKAFECKKEDGSDLTSYTAVLRDVRRVCGDTRMVSVKDYLQSLILSIPFESYRIAEMSFSVMEHSPLIFEGAINVPDLYGVVLEVREITPDDYFEFEDYYWDLMSEVVLTEAYKEKETEDAD